MQAKNLNLDSYISFNIFKQIFRNFCQGGWGLGPTARKQPGQCFFYFYFFFFFFISAYFTIYGGGPTMVLLQRKLYFPKDPEGMQHFPGGWVQLSWGGGGSECLFL